MALQDNEGFTEVAMGLQSGMDANQGVFASAPDAPRTHESVIFYHESVQDHAASAAQGRPIFKMVEFIRIMVPGDKTTEIVRPVRFGHTPKHDNMKYPRQYAAFKQNREQTIEGTPLKAWPILNKAQVEELRYLKIYTVEQLAELADSTTQRHTGLVKLKRLARAFLDKAESGKGITEMERQLDTLQQEKDALAGQVAELVREVQLLRKANAGFAAPPPPADEPQAKAPETFTVHTGTQSSSLDELDEDLYGSEETTDGEETADENVEEAPEDTVSEEAPKRRKRKLVKE